MSTLIDAIQSIVRYELQKLHLVELGIVEAVYPHSEEGDNDNYQCDVRLKNRGVVLRRVQVATQHIGLANAPHAPGDLVLVAFVNGDINAPIVIGRLYNDEDRPPLSKMEEIVYEPPYEKNPNLCRIRIKLPEGTVVISIYDNRININVGGSRLSMDAGGNISLRSRQGENAYCQLQLDKDGNVNIETLSSGNRSQIAMSNSGTLNMVTEAGGIPCSITSDGNGLSIETKGDVTLKAMNIKMESQTNLEIKAMNIKMESQTNLDMKANVMANLEAQSLTSVKGGIVRIN
ncbi:hypothetical protein KEJ36_03495 [Candidatus Bathyarchaeota archaeon]|nr:hypothetical protein [Candidatus Bathyarchaeota archaeon]MBS7627867.1 hypothetical protein [Candidatus Bathyarchaeota archaeon]